VDGRKNGAIVHFDYDYNELSRLTFHEALVTEFAMPALDASSKDPAMMTVKFKPEWTRKTFGGGGKKTSSNLKPDVQKKWLPANFRLRFTNDASFDSALQKVNKIEALTIKQKVVENAIGEQRDYQQEPAAIEFPNLVITLAESHADKFYKWHENFVINGRNGHDQEKTGDSGVPVSRSRHDPVHAEPSSTAVSSRSRRQDRSRCRVDPPREGRDVLRRDQVLLQQRYLQVV
jgi:hypothetical protein